MKYVYKIVAALGALATIPMIIFSKIIYFNMSSVALQLFSYILHYKGNASMEEILAETGGQIPGNVADSYSLYDIYNFGTKISGLLNKAESANEALDILVTPVILFVVVCVLIVICAIVTAVFAIVAKDNRKVIFSSVCGMGLSYMLYCIFEDIADPILNGTVSLSSLMNSWLGGLIGQFEAFNLTAFFWFIPLVFAAVIVWTVIYNATLPENEKRERKLMLGEADDQ